MYMPRYFTVLAMVAAMGFVLSANAVVTTPPAGREYKIYPTANATFALVQGRRGLVLVKKTAIGRQQFAIEANGLRTVAEADQRLMQPLIAKYGLDEALARLEDAVSVDSDEGRFGGAQVILVDGVETPRRRYPPRQPLPEEDLGDDSILDGAADYPPPPPQVQIIIQQYVVAPPVPRYGGVPAPVMVPMPRPAPCDRRVYGPYCGY
jgi:hypothetical protein